jgi:hypothetical protein
MNKDAIEKEKSKEEAPKKTLKENREAGGEEVEIFFFLLLNLSMKWLK